MILRKAVVSTVLALSILTWAPPAAFAEHGYGWHGDIRHFRDHDFRRWRGGRWIHGHHGGYLGWWWVVGGLWYFYSQPVYPYPDPYVPPVVVEQQPPPVIIQQAPPQTTPVPPPAAGTQYWYYCQPAGAYYPYVATCPSGWKKVPAAPPGAPQ